MKIDFIIFDQCEKEILNNFGSFYQCENFQVKHGKYCQSEVIMSVSNEMS